jgi:hypothetical protein
MAPETEHVRHWLQRADYYTEWAAAQTDPQARQEFLDMAKRWRVLAEESTFIANLSIERHGKHRPRQT